MSFSASSVFSPFAVIRSTASISLTYGATVGFVCLSIISLTDVSIALSPMPAILSVLDTSVYSCLEARNGLTCSVNIGFISLGGPGIIIRILPFSSIIIPGAVPLSLYMIIAPSGIIACFILFSVMSRPNLEKNFFILFNALSSRYIFLSKYSAPISFVRSSPVGPNPPVVIITSARSNAKCIASFILFGLSPTTV
ncbi:hypothetical protein SDC9_120575 [bioreactor metagenome]|uniref:Uncharacterized protein n=1 Tax=bioreactor metagenome TaxID=1076179 RepID=A0A645C9D1_9ZZZZ